MVCFLITLIGNAVIAVFVFTLKSKECNSANRKGFLKGLEKKKTL